MGGQVDKNFNGVLILMSLIVGKFMKILISFFEVLKTRGFSQIRSRCKRGGVLKCKYSEKTTVQNP